MMARVPRVLGTLLLTTVGLVPHPASGQEAPAGPELDALMAALPGRAISLETALASALEGSLSLVSARTSRRLADADLLTVQGDFDVQAFLSGDIADEEGAGGRRIAGYQAGLSKRFWPGTRLSVDWTGARTDLEPLGIDDTTLSSFFTLSAEQPLLEGMGIADVGVRVARAELRAAERTLQRSEEEILAGVELLYWDLREAEAVEAVLQRSYEVALDLERRNQELFTRDLVAEVDVVTARGGAALRRSALVDARRGRRDASDALVFLVYGERAPTVLERDTLPLRTLDRPRDPAIGDLLPLDDAIDLALARRSDLAAAREQLEGAQARERYASRGLLPDLSLLGRVTTDAGTTVPDVAGPFEATSNWSLGLSLRQPLFNRADRGQERAARIQRELQELRIAEVENVVREQVRAAHRAVSWGVERLIAAREAAELARQQLDAEQRRLGLGLGDSFRLLETEENVVSAQLAEVQAGYGLARARVRLALATGEAISP